MTVTALSLLRVHSGHRQKSGEREKLCRLVEAASCDVSGGVMVHGWVVCSALAAADEVNMDRWINSQVWQERCSSTNFVRSC